MHNRERGHEYLLSRFSFPSEHGCACFLFRTSEIHERLCCHERELLQADNVRQGSQTDFGAQVQRHVRDIVETTSGRKELSQQA